MRTPWRAGDEGWGVCWIGCWGKVASGPELWSQHPTHCRAVIASLPLNLAQSDASIL